MNANLKMQWQKDFKIHADKLKQRLKTDPVLDGFVSEGTLAQYEEIVDLHLSAYPIDAHFDPLDLHRSRGSDFLTATKLEARWWDGLLKLILTTGKNRPLWGHVFNRDLDPGGFGGLVLSAHANVENLIDFLPQDPWDNVKESHDYFEDYRARAEELNPGSLTWCKSAQDVEDAQKAGKRALLFGCEGAHVLGKSNWRNTSSDNDDLRLQRVRQLKSDYGAVYLTIDHYCYTDISSAGIPFNQHRRWRRKTEGLSDFGKTFVQTVFEEGLLVDVAHSCDTALLDICEIALRLNKPVIASHAGMRSHTLTERPGDWINGTRMLSDASITKIVETGGAIAVGINPIWFMPKKAADGSLKQFVAHYSAIAEFISALPAVGSRDKAFDHLIFGTDFDGGLSAIPLELRSGGDLLLLTLAMWDAGWSGHEIQRVYSKNYIRMLRLAQGH